jgi:hypothetical protein
MRKAKHFPPSIATLMASFDKFRSATTELNQHSISLWRTVQQIGFPENLILNRPVLKIRAGMKALRPSQWNERSYHDVEDFKILLERWWKHLNRVQNDLGELPEVEHDKLTRLGICERIQQARRRLRQRIDCPQTEWCRDDFSLWFVEWALCQASGQTEGSLWPSSMTDSLAEIAKELKAAAQSLRVKTTVYGLTRAHIKEAAAVVQKRGKSLATEQMVSHLQSKSQLSRSEALICLQVLRFFNIYTPSRGRSPREQQAARVQDVVTGLKLAAKFFT